MLVEKFRIEEFFWMLYLVTHYHKQTQFMIRHCYKFSNNLYMEDKKKPC